MNYLNSNLTSPTGEDGIGAMGQSNQENQATKEGKKEVSQKK